jgi:hypothetical protein
MHLLNASVKQSIKIQNRKKRIDYFLIFINRFNEQIVILTCSGKLGDDEVVCRWKRVENTVMNIYFFLERLMFLFLESMDE